MSELARAFTGLITQAPTHRKVRVRCEVCNFVQRLESPQKIGDTIWFTCHGCENILHTLVQPPPRW